MTSYVFGYDVFLPCEKLAPVASTAYCRCRRLCERILLAAIELNSSVFAGQTDMALCFTAEPRYGGKGV